MNLEPCPRFSFRRAGLVAGLALPFVLLPTSFLEAQQTGSVTGTVTDAASLRPVSDARVFIVGTAVQAFTDVEGSYRLSEVPAGEVEMRLERLGYASVDSTLQVAAGQTFAVDFSLLVSALALDELLVTATGLQRRRELGNATAVIRVDDELERAAPVNLSALLQGRATGVQVLQSSGTVGTASTIKIRGNGTISLSNTPLIYIDGARVSNSVQSGPGVGGQTTSRLNDLTLEDIESVEIVRGPSAATLYGAEAAAGVIRITTKRGRTGAAEWTFRSEWGANWDDTDWPETVWNPLSFFDALQDVSELFAPGQIPPGTNFATIPDTLYTMNLLGDGVGGDTSYGTPWRTGVEQTFGASLRGGSESVTYFLSGEFSAREGTLANNESTQRNFRANFNLFPSEKVDIALSTGYSYNLVSLPDNDNNAFGYIGVAMVGFPWATPIKRTDLVVGGEWMTCPLAYEVHRATVSAGVATTLESLSENNCADNPFFSERTFDDVATLSNTQKIERLTVSTTAHYRPLDYLTATGTVGYDQFSDRTGFFVPVNPDLPFGDASRGLRSIGHGLNRLLTLEANVNATYEIFPELHSVTSVGIQFFRQKFESTGATGRILPLGSRTVSSAVETEGFESIGETRTLGVFVQQQFGYRDRLFFTPGLRLDDSSAFGENLGRQAYPRVMASYVISDEDWFEDFVPGTFVESLRLRAAWGRSGKQPASFAALKLLGPRRVTFRGEDVAGLSLVGPGNPGLKPERGQEVEVGFEVDLLDGRLGLDFTWFRQTTKDAIVGKRLAPSTGYSGPLFTNIGEMTNRGVELGLSYVVLNTRARRWDWRLNVSTAKGEITDLAEPIIFGLGGDSQRHEEGHPYASYFSRTYTIDESGDAMASDSAVFVGHPTPELEGSISTTLELFGWVTLSAHLGFAAGHQQFNSTEQFRCGFLGGGTYGGVCTQLFEVGPDGERTSQAKIKAAAGDDLQYAPWIEDADFARLRSVSARFELPQGWLARMGARRGSFTIVGENLALFTKYKGLDPEVSFAGGSQSVRAEFFTLPLAKRITGQLSISF